MTEIKQTDISDILGDISSHGPLLSTHQRKFDAILTHFAAKGLPLTVCGDERHLNRAVSTLQKRARLLGLAFPDYCPRALRPLPDKPRRKSVTQRIIEGGNDET